MKTGIEMDKLVAEKVLGVPKVDLDGLTGLFGRVCKRTGFSLNNYSTDVKAAWEVVDELKELDFDLSRQFIEEKEMWMCVFTDEMGRQFTALSPSVADAICMSGLFVVGCSIEELNK